METIWGALEISIKKVPKSKCDQECYITCLLYSTSSEIDYDDKYFSTTPFVNKIKDAMNGSNATLLKVELLKIQANFPGNDSSESHPHIISF